MPENVHECVKSVLDDNPEMVESRAWAICQAEMQADAEEIEVNTLDDLTGIKAADIDDLVAESDWAGADGVWWHEDEQLVVYDSSAAPSQQADLPDECRKCGESDRMEGSMVCQDCADGPDQQTITISGLSQEAVTDIERRYNADVTVVDGEDPAAPTDTAAEAE